ncbi:SigB/SigF/SigG family RNA polymerase sigma factor [Mycobacterium bourgelatii]|uniref:RNA polymerase sigma factor SigF n=1 Tax=Mycobacterium bourgelatii TaxID=1273442 RepID=A0A7I9YKA0_MYCBU|nr:SigB/SigF/SigG family RNA polymerase sigma factor [Mycobacterium bourgelatii]MCV6973383.1 SigB/SigF/SigG family RNA polymerase sigma factor [Mycobacterium bourgelatii]GFG89048.1 RNA polymerase sigma factor SigF [Mycobacterium bourgelatii]
MTLTGEYADVAEMFRRLNELPPESVAYRQQRDLIVQRCLPLADHIASRYRGRGESLDDLVQVARVGLINAVNRFDIDNGADFLAFAVPTITGEVRRHFRDHGWAVKVPRRIKELQSQLNTATNDLTRQLQRAPNASELAERLGIDRAVVVDVMVANSNYSVLSMDAPRGEGDEGDSLKDTMGSTDPSLEKILSVETVRPLIAALPERERMVIKLRFFDEMTQTEIAERVGCSQMHVSRLLARALDKLRSGAHRPDLAATG